MITRFSIGLAIIMTACSGYNGALTPIPCLFNGQSQLIYPIPNATNVPINNDPNPNIAANGNSAFFQRIQSSQIPQPSATPAISNAFYESAAIGTTSLPHGTYYVFLNDTLGGCTPTSAGSFTTQ